MQQLVTNSLNPKNNFSENPEAFLLEHCGNLVAVGGGSLEERILFFVRRLKKLKAYVPPLDLNKFPKELHTEKIKTMCGFLQKDAA